MKFSYVKFDDKYLPVVPLIVKGKVEAEINAFVDSGAGVSVFNYDIGEILGIDVEKGKKEFVKIGDGSFIEIFVHTLHVKLAGKAFKAEIGFSRGLGVGFNILGRKDMFENFIVSFNEKEKTIEFAAF
jgi:hypothetical protein